MPQGTPGNWQHLDPTFDHSVDETGVHTVRALTPQGEAAHLSWNANGLTSVQQQPWAHDSGAMVGAWSHAMQVHAADPENVPRPEKPRYGFITGTPRVNRGL